MYSRVTTVCNPTGLHARPATEFVAQAKKYASKITICLLYTSDAADE